MFEQAGRRTQVMGILNVTEDSFSDGLLEGPSYTKPREWRGLSVPDVLTSGDHAKVDRWRREQSLKRTLERRPELLETAELDAADRAYLEALKEDTSWT